ncbi:hypothetical protein BDW59DRAFT_167751 [Aspergillus cavernicola]|uniref:Heterokaryon incompatibility domain-containing protein n=1 Tax=Aspergillus cavernicola TaxID=176166 RepID=A0ABR4HBA1_9EURO
MFETAELVIDQFCKISNDDDVVVSPLRQEQPRPWPVRDKISTTMIALVYTLRGAAIHACKPDIDRMTPWPVAARSEILDRRLRGKWCVADVTTTLKQLPIDGHYYLAGALGLEADELDHHAKCVRAHCCYDYDLDMYITRHTTVLYHKAGCRTEIEHGGQLGPERGQKDWVDAIGSLSARVRFRLRCGIRGCGRCFRSSTILRGRGRRIMVNGDSWTDGKGKPKASSLPECQIDKIQHLVEAVSWEGRKEVPSNPRYSNGVGFWMDTLCIPAVDKERRDDAIKNMRHVYSHTKAVLVLDDWLEMIRCDAPALEVISRMYQSNWLKRLWTHQEGFLPPALWFQFADRSVEVNDTKSRLEDHQKPLQATGIYLGFPGNANLRLVELYTFLASAFKEIDKDDKWMLYNTLARATSERKSSRLADEILCQKRMARFLKQLDRFDAGIVFNNYERLEERGYKWAPRSLLNLRTAVLTYLSDNEGDCAFEKVNGQLGLLVRYHRFMVNFANGQPILRSC